MKSLKSTLLASGLMLVALFFINAKVPSGTKHSYVNFEKLLTERHFMLTSNFIDYYCGKPQLSTDYNLLVTDSKISGELPATYNGQYNDSGQNFSGPYSTGVDYTSNSISRSSRFSPSVKLDISSYTYKAATSGTGWQVEIKPSNDKNIKLILMSITKDGETLVNVVNKKSTIYSFKGYISQVPSDN